MRHLPPSLPYRKSVARASLVQVEPVVDSSPPLPPSPSSRAEIDVIFARGYIEKVWYVKMAKEMPRLSGAEIEGEWRRLGLSDEDRPQSAMGDNVA